MKRKWGKVWKAILSPVPGLFRGGPAKSVTAASQPAQACLGSHGSATREGACEALHTGTRHSNGGKRERDPGPGERVAGFQPSRLPLGDVYSKAGLSELLCALGDSCVLYLYHHPHGCPFQTSLSS